jgi:tetratricopeptide (TPR) repeat protein
MKSRRKSKPGGPPQLAGWKLWSFRLLALALPLLLLALAEVALRVAGCGYPTAFLLPSSNHGQRTYVQNNSFGWRFFGKRKSRTPSAISILQEKPADTIRIFMFGESAAFGDPQPAFGLPRVLQAMLSLHHPEMKFEVVNAAMTAINSHVIVPIARDCAGARGDIWVIYMGNNEFVGPFGAGTVFGSQTLPLTLIRGNLALKSTRIGQLMNAVLERKAPADKSEWGGMEMFLDQQVRDGDPKIAGVYRNFERNLRDIIGFGRESGAAVVVSTVAVNLKDCAPFASRPRAGLSEADVRKIDELVKLGTQAQAAGTISEAVAKFKEAAQLDSGSADLQFRLGRCLLASGNIPAAQKAFSNARDLDTLRFRCDSHLNDIVRKVASDREAERVLLADAEHDFAAASLDGIPGWDLFYEHVHFTFEGNYLLARTLAEQVEKLLPQKSAASNPAWPTIADCARRLGRTDRDLKSAVIDMCGRLSGPPFATQMNHDEQMRHLADLGRKAEMGASVAEALQVAKTASEMAPGDAQLYEQISTLEESGGHYAEAETAARRAVDLLPSSGDDWFQLGTTLVKEKKYEDAAAVFQRAYDLNPQDVWPLQNLAMSLVKLDRKEEAMRVYKRALEITPRFGLAWLGLGELLESMGRKQEAEDCYKKALENRILRVPELETLARFCMSRGWVEAASTNYDEVMKLDPFDPGIALEAGQAHFLAGAKLGKAGQSGAAAREFREAVRLMPGVVEARLNLGIALYRDGKWNESLSELEKVIERSPTNALARQYLESVREKIGPQTVR